MSATRDREAWDIYLGIIAALLTLFALAMTAEVTVPHWWAKFLTFAGLACLCVLGTQPKRQIIVGIAVIVMFRLFVLFITWRWAVAITGAAG